MATKQTSASLRYPPILVRTGAAACIASFLCEFLPHTLFLEKYKNILHYYKYGQPAALNKEIEKLKDVVLNDLKINQIEQKSYEFFPITGFQTYNAGIVSNYCHSIIGIPEYYTYKDVSHVNTSKIRLGYDKNPIDIYHPQADTFLNSLVLSEKAKKFGIAREVLMNTKKLPVYRSIENACIFSFTAILLEYGIRKLHLSKKALAIKMLYYIPVSLSSFSLWFQFRDKLKTYFEKTVDKTLAELGPDYVEGGKEFYQKQLQRNIALRSLLGEQGIRAYNRDGNELFFIRQKTTPITHRKKFFDEFKYENNEDVIATNVM